MANAYNSTTSAVGTNIALAAYDRYIEMALRATPFISDLADKKPAQQAMAGSSVVFQIFTDLAVATSPLSETVNPDAVALGATTTISVPLVEYGNSSLATRKLELTSLTDFDAALADIVAFNMKDTIDTIALNELVFATNGFAYAAGTLISTYNATYTNGVSQGLVQSTDIIKSAAVRTAVAKLRTNKVVPRSGEDYWVGIHPEVSFDFRSETGSAGWRDDHKYSETGASEFWAGTIGTYEGAMFVESPRMFNTADGATGTAANTSYTGTFGTTSYVYGTTGTRVFRTLIAGKQALALAIGEAPTFVAGPIVDPLMRVRPIGWRALLGFKRYRPEALIRLETTSSIHLT